MVHVRFCRSALLAGIWKSLSKRCSQLTCSFDKRTQNPMTRSYTLRALSIVYDRRNSTAMKEQCQGLKIVFLLTMHLHMHPFGDTTAAGSTSRGAHAALSSHRAGCDSHAIIRRTGIHQSPAPRAATAHITSDVFQLRHHAAQPASMNEVPEGLTTSAPFRPIEKYFFS